MITVKNLCRSFNKNSCKTGDLYRKMPLKPTTINSCARALNDVSFHIPSGEVVGLIGLNGAGKTTLIKLITGALTPTSGIVRVFGKEPVANRIEVTQKIGTVFGVQSGLDSDLTVKTNFELIKLIFKISKDSYISNLAYLNKLLQLDDLMNFKVSQLSLGQRIKTEIASALLHNPSLLILDEPFIGIDIKSKENIRNLLLEIKNGSQSTVLLTTHNMEEAEKICSRIIILDKGSMLYYGDMDRLAEKYEHTVLLEAVVKSKYPDFQNLPLIKYTIDGFKVNVLFDSSIIDSKAVTKHIISQCEISDLKISKPRLSEIIQKFRR